MKILRTSACESRSSRFILKLNFMVAKIFWNNGHISKVGAYYNETVQTFEERVLKSYGKYDVKIMLCPYNTEGYYIK
jgi:hypothetical protein